MLPPFLELFYPIHLHVQHSRRTWISSLPHNSTSLSISSSLHIAATALLWEAFTQMSLTRSESACLQFAFCLHRFIKPCHAIPYWASTPVQSVPSRHGTARIVSVRVYTDITNRAVPCWPAFLSQCKCGIRYELWIASGPCRSIADCTVQSQVMPARSS